MSDRSQRPVDATDLLAAYELGLLSDDDRARFEAVVADNPDLLEELYDAAPDALAMRARPDRFAAAARAGLKAGHAENRIGFWARICEALRPRVLVPVAAALAIATVVVWPDHGGFDPTALAVVEAIPVTQMDRRTATRPAEQLYAAAVTAYANQHWADAARDFQVALTNADSGWERRHQAQLYLGSSLLLDERGAEAVAPLEAASASPVAPIREQATWHLAQAKLLAADAVGAREVLLTLRESPVFGQRAAALLSRLDH